MMRILAPKKLMTLRTVSGFTLAEVLISLFVFSLMMVAVAQIFGTAFSGYRSTRAIQRDIDNAQYSLNIIGKELRTSSVVVPVSGPSDVQAIQFYDHSQGRCIRYRISGGNLQVASSAVADVAACAALSLGSFTNISTGVISGSFKVIPSATTPLLVVGKVTVSLDISEGSAHHALIQTTVSLRDFGNIGL